MTWGRRPSRTYFGVACSSGERPQSAIALVVVHQTQGGTAKPPSAENAAKYLKGRPDGSAHLVIDAEEAYRLASDTTICCGVRDYNTPTLHVEMTGKSSWSALKWALPSRRKMVDHCAYRVARWLKRYGLQTKWRSTKDLDAGRVRGITSHAALTYSRLSTSTHTDPGLGFPRRWFMRRVSYWLDQ